MRFNIVGEPELLELPHLLPEEILKGYIRNRTATLGAEQPEQMPPCRLAG